MSWPFDRNTRRAWLGVASTVLVMGLAGCVTPTLPPDDPPQPDIIEIGTGTARLVGHVGEGPAFVLVHNRVSGLVFGQRTEFGAYDFEVRAERCDLLSLWYTMGRFQSTAIRFRPADVAEHRGACSSAEALSGDAGAAP